MSVSVAREVVRVLESMGMVRSRRRVGVTVLGRGEWNVFDPRLIRWRLASEDRAAQLQSLSELRRGFEPVAAGLAATHATAEQCGVLAGAVSDMVVHGHSGDLEAYLVADVTFHRTLLEASGNEMFRALGDVVAEVLAGRTHHGLMPDRPNPRGDRAARHGRARRTHRGREGGRAGHARAHRGGGRGDAGRARRLSEAGSCASPSYENWHGATEVSVAPCQFHNSCC